MGLIFYKSSHPGRVPSDFAIGKGGIINLIYLLVTRVSRIGLGTQHSTRWNDKRICAGNTPQKQPVKNTVWNFVFGAVSSALDDGGHTFTPNRSTPCFDSRPINRKSLKRRVVSSEISARFSPAVVSQYLLYTLLSCDHCATGPVHLFPAIALKLFPFSDTTRKLRPTRICFCVDLSLSLSRSLFSSFAVKVAAIWYAREKRCGENRFLF